MGCALGEVAYEDSTLVVGRDALVWRGMEVIILVGSIDRGVRLAKAIDSFAEIRVNSRLYETVTNGRIARVRRFITGAGCSDGHWARLEANR